MISAGIHKAKAITPVEFHHQDNENETPYAHVLCEVTEGSDAGAQIIYKGWTSEKGKEKTRQALAAMGYEAGNPQSVLDKAFSIKVEHETYEGQTYARVKYVNPIGGRHGKPQSAADIAAFDEYFRSAAAVSKGNSAKPESDVRF